MKKGFSLIEVILSMFLISCSLIPLNFLIIKLVSTNKMINKSMDKIYIEKNILEEVEKLNEKICENKQFNDLFSLLSFLEIKEEGIINLKEKYIVSIFLIYEDKYYIIYEIRINKMRGYRIIEKD